MRRNFTPYKVRWVGLCLIAILMVVIGLSWLLNTDEDQPVSYPMSRTDLFQNYGGLLNIYSWQKFINKLPSYPNETEHCLSTRQFEVLQT